MVFTHDLDTRFDVLKDFFQAEAWIGKKAFVSNWIGNSVFETIIHDTDKVYYNIYGIWIERTINGTKRDFRILRTENYISNI